MASLQQEWRETAEGTLEDLDYVIKKRKLKIHDWYRLFWSIGAALVSISLAAE